MEYRKSPSAGCRQSSSPSHVWLTHGITVSFLPRRDLLLLLHLLAASDHCRASLPSASFCPLTGWLTVVHSRLPPRASSNAQHNTGRPRQNPRSFLPVPFFFLVVS